MSKRIKEIRAVYARHRELSGTRNITLSAQRACDLLDYIDKLENEISILKGENKHDWECIGPGMYDSVYKCKKCGISAATQVDNLNSKLPDNGCILTKDRA